MASLDVPFYKLMISDLIVAEKVQKSSYKRIIPPEESDSEELTMYKIRLNNRDVGCHKKNVSTDLTVTHVWLQGTIKEMKEEGTIKISDGTGDVIVQDYKDVAGGRSPHLKNGAYIGILGKLISNPSPIVLKAVKIMKLENSDLKAIWSMEVRELKATLLNL